MTGHAPHRLRLFRSLCTATALTALSISVNADKPLDADTDTITGTVTIVRRSGIPARAFIRNPAYDTRAFRKVTLVDYSNPGPVIVYLDAGEDTERPAASVEIQLKRVRGRLVFEPSLAVSTYGTLSITNTDTKPHIVYVKGPNSAKQVRLSPEGVTHLDMRHSGAHALYLLDADTVEGLLFIGGTHASFIDSDGAYQLSRIPQGQHRVHAWHARFPPASTNAVIDGSRPVQVHFTLGVEHLPAPE